MATRPSFRAAIAAAALAVLAGAAPASADVGAWLGYLGTEQVGGAGFFDNAEVRAQVTGLIGESRLRRVEAMDTASVVEEYSGAIIAQFCSGANCAGDNVALLFDGAGGVIAACVFDDQGADGVFRSWRGGEWSVIVARATTNKNCFVTPPEIIRDYKAAVTLAK